MSKTSFKYSLFYLFLIILTGCSKLEVQTSEAKLTQHYSELVLKAADISDDGKYSLISNNKKICLWDNQKNSKAYPCLSGLEAQLIELVGISSSKRYFYTSNRINVHLYDFKTGRLITVWTAGDNIINDIAMSADESTLLFGFRSGQASIVSVKTNQITTFQIHRLDINSVSLSADGKTAFTGSSDKNANVWQTSTGDILKTFIHKSRVNHVTLSKDGKNGFTLDAIKGRYFWQVDEGKEMAELQSNIRFIEFNDSKFSDDNSLLLSASPKQKLQAWRVKDGELVGEWQAYKVEHRDRASVINITQISAKEIATITSDGIYQTWSLLPFITLP